MDISSVSMGTPAAARESTGRALDLKEQLPHAFTADALEEQDLFLEDRVAFAEQQLQLLTERLQKQSILEGELAKVRAELQQEQAARQQLQEQFVMLLEDIPKASAALQQQYEQKDVPTWVSETAGDVAGHLERITLVCAAGETVSRSQKLLICEAAARAAQDALHGLSPLATPAATLMAPPEVNHSGTMDKRRIINTCSDSCLIGAGDIGAGPAQVPSAPPPRLAAFAHSAHHVSDSSAVACANGQSLCCTLQRGQFPNAASRPFARSPTPTIPNSQVGCLNMPVKRSGADGTTAGFGSAARHRAPSVQFSDAVDIQYVPIHLANSDGRVQKTEICHGKSIFGQDVVDTQFKLLGI